MPLSRTPPAEPIHEEPGPPKDSTADTHDSRLGLFGGGGGGGKGKLMRSASEVNLALLLPFAVKRSSSRIDNPGSVIGVSGIAMLYCPGEFATPNLADKRLGSTEDPDLEADPEPDRE